MSMPIRFQPTRRCRCAWLAFLGALLCGSALAQGFPGGGGHAGGHGSRGAPPDNAHRNAAAETNKAPEPLAALLRSAHGLRQDLLLDATQTARWSALQDDLRDALDKQNALHPKPTDTTHVPNPAALYVQDAAAAYGAYAHALEKAAQSLDAAFDALDARQRKTATERMAAALASDAPA